MDSVQPLRISKTTPSSTPSKMMAVTRPLSELGSGERRRNSPSYNQATRKMIVSREASPYVENSPTKESPRSFWSRDAMSPSRFDTENTPERSPSPSLLSPKRRASIEKLKQASRVRTSNIFALQTKDTYDPSNLPIVERPSANRPLSNQVANNTFARFDSLRKENNPLRSPQRMGHKRTETEIHVPTLSSTPARTPLPPSPHKEASPSPTKSSLARARQFGTNFDPENGIWSDEDRAATPRGLHRHHKSVTFHEEPPEVNEYEEQTPEPSVSAGGSREGSWDSDDFDDQDISFDRGSSAEFHQDDSFDDDLENADKTPVVLPEDWSRMSPEEARTELVDASDDVFESSLEIQRPILGRSESVASDGESRPLPPLPAFMKERRNSDSLSAAAERASHAHRNLPSPPKRASCSKDEILRMTRESPLSLEDRLQLISEKKERPSSKHSNNSENEHGIPEELTLTNLDTGEKLDLQVSVAENEIEEDSIIASLDDFSNSPPKISRESILRKVRNDKYDFEVDDDDDLDESFAAGLDSPGRPSYAELARMHPDEPVPSRENSRETSDSYRTCHTKENSRVEEVTIKQEPFDEDDLDMTAIPMAVEHQSTLLHTPLHKEDCDRQSSVVRHAVDSPRDSGDDSGSRYSSAEPEAESTVLYAEREATAEANDGKETLLDAMQLLTVKDYSAPAPAPAQGTERGMFEGLPAYQSTDDYDFGMKQYITSSSPQANKHTKPFNIMAHAPVLQPDVDDKSTLLKDLPRPAYDGAEFSPPISPISPRVSLQSVIQDGSEISALDEEHSLSNEAVPRDSPSIPERRATIRTGGKLKARPSATPADLHMMAQQRRLVSAEHPVPPIPQAYHAEIEQTTESELQVESAYSSETEGSKADSGLGNSPESSNEEEKIKLNLNIPAFSGETAGDGLCLDKEFDRLIEAQKKGYLMRQNTKVVIASNRNFSNESNDTAKSNDSVPMSPTGDAPPRPLPSKASRSAGNSPRKPSADQVLKTEPWNGKSRRKSQRNMSAQQAYRHEPAPPLPGQPSALGVVEEDFAAGTSSLEDEVAEGVERGRLFVKVVGVKDLELPMSRTERVYFQLTLDNGLHCVTTANLELGKTAPIGQEFELVVLNDLEFQLTLTTRLPEPPQVQLTAPPSPTKSAKASSKTTGLSRFLTSPKKRAERERQEREVAQAEELRSQQEAQRKRASMQPTAWDLLHELVNGVDGSFARAYVNLKSHEKQCFGRQLTVSVPCYNEWALEKDAAVVSSVRSKRGNAGPIRRPPYVIGQLELQLLYVPKPKGATDDDMPKSMSNAMREMSKVSEVKEIVHEGHLSQQGGDCIHWRRRFFRLQGSKLTAYHEHTHQKRAVINLSKASRLVDDKSTLVADPKSGNPSSKSGRRKSAFAEEDEGYQYVEEGFRIRFANGETIDFYADSHAEKDIWMQILSQVIGKPDVGKKAATWTDLVLARERVEGGGDGAESSQKPSSTSDVRDFMRSPVPAPSQRKPIAAAAMSKSAPNSPMKGPPQQRPPPPPAQASALKERPLTPPMNPRKGHRSRDAVKSMIF